MIKISEARKRMMNHGDVFVGLNKIRNQGQKNLIEAERHNKWMDMQGIEKRDPVKWIKSFMIGRQRDHVERKLEEMIKEYGSVNHPAARPYYESKNSKYNLEFYKYALNYLKKHY